jgi:hypothetical protein
MYNLRRRYVGKFSCTVVIKPSLHIKSNTLHEDKPVRDPVSATGPFVGFSSNVLFTNVVKEVLSFVKISAVTVILYSAV